MRITGWHIDGFGTFANHAVQEIPPGLTVFSGPNEAGKSTLLAFVRGMLFGFHGTARKPSFPPLRGGNHSGRIFLGTDDGAPVVVERQATRRGLVRVTMGGIPGSEPDLRALLGGCDEDVFRSVFAFGLSELQQMDSLDRGDIGERIFSAGVVGAGRSAHAVLKDLETRKAVLLKRAPGRARINELMRELDATTSRMMVARQVIGAYDELGRRITDADAQVTHHAHALEQARSQRERVVTLGNLWPTWHERRESASALAVLTANSTLDRISTDTDELIRDLGRYRDWLEQHRVADAKREAADRALSERLRELGPTWDRTRLAAFDRSIPRAEEVRGHEMRLDEARAARDRAAAEAQASQDANARADRTATESAALQAELPLPPTRSELDRMAETVRSLRANNADLAAVESRAHAAAASIATIEQSRPGTAAADPFSGATIGYGLGLAAAVLLGMAVWQGLNGTIVVAIALGLIALVLAYLAVSTVRRTAPLRAEHERTLAQFTTRLEIAKAEHDGYVARQNELQDIIAAGAARLSLLPQPSNHDIEAADRRVVQFEDAHRIHVQATRQAALDADRAKAQALEAAAAAERADAAAQAHQEVLTGWEAWKSSAEIPAELTPQGVLDFFDRVRVGRDLLLGLEDAERETTSESARIGAFETRALATISAADLPMATAGDGIADAIVTLGRAVEQNRATERVMDEHRQTIDRCERSLTDALGDGPHAGSMRTALATGEVELWRSEAAEAADDMEVIGAGRDAALETRVKAIQEREAVEASSDIARYELDRTALQEELHTAVHEWRVLAVAEGLIRDTLARFERERQPEVLQHASRLFDVVSAGEYTRIFRPIGDASGLSIETRDGRVLRPEMLSQGTREQLYLCVRLGLAADHAARTSSLPLVMDDVLVNFDPGRAKAVAEALCDFAQDHQVLLFTCHPHTVDLLQSIQPDCRHFALQRYGTGGEWVASA